MFILKKLLYQNHLIKLDELQIREWIENKNINDLEFALQNGDFLIRKQVLLGLGKLQSKTSINLILKYIDDKIANVSLAAIQTLKEIGVDEKTDIKLDEKIKYWENKNRMDIEKAKTYNKNRANETVKWERPSKQTFENAKEMLKKPMLGGKWI